MQAATIAPRACICEQTELCKSRLGYHTLISVRIILHFDLNVCLDRQLRRASFMCMSTWVR